MSTKLKVGDEVCIIHNKFIFIDYNPEANIFECSGDITDKVKSSYRGPSSLKISRFSIPGRFCNIKVDQHFKFVIEEAKSMGYNGWGYDGRVGPDDHLLVEQEGFKYKVREDLYFEENGVYYLDPVNHGGDIIQKAAGRTRKFNETGRQMVGHIWDGSDIKGEIDRIFTFVYGYRTEERGDISTMFMDEIKYYDELDFREYPLRHCVGVVTTSEFEQWNFPLRHLKKIVIR